MAKVFRLHEGNNTILDWQESSVYDSDVINQIQDPDGATAKKEITSIPSPFARIDLLKTAFKVISESGELEGNTIYHKMVSDTLDVAELFFNYHRYSQYFKIMIWDRNNDLAQLINSSCVEHKSVGNTLSMFLQQDREAYNFDRLSRFYILKYVGPGAKSQSDIVGATSPSTLFFSTANDMSYISKYISFNGQYAPFDGKYTSLKDRDSIFIKYLFALRASHSKFAVLFREVGAYLDLCYSQLSYEMQQSINATTGTTNYPNLTLNGNQVEIVNDLPYGTYPSGVTPADDFKIRATVSQNVTPLVLPITTGNQYSSLTYINAAWNGNNQPPFEDKCPIANRTLPFVGNIIYPYLTVCDFLEDTIIKMPYLLNDSKFFSAGFQPTNNKIVSYLLPIKSTFFDYFTIDDLVGNIPNTGKPMVEMEHNVSGVSVILRIPIVGNGTVNFIEYKRLYFENNAVNLSRNEGAIKEVKFGLGMLPMIKQSTQSRVALYDKNSANVSLEFLSGSTSVNAVKSVRREKDNVACSIETYVLDKPFDVIVLKAGEVRGLIVPKYQSHEGNSVFTYAVDFGTSNTHIEYSVDRASEKAFDITPAETQLHRLHKGYGADEDINFAFEHNLIPSEIGEGEPYSFPIRSVFAESVRIDYNGNFYSMADGNIPFRYGKDRIPKYNRVKTNLKWSSKDRMLLGLYIENICMLLRNKVILNNGSLQATRIIWFYPASMITANFNSMSAIWRSKYEQYFGGPSTNVISLSESVAPYIYYRKKKGAKQDVVTIDVGGGTSDVFYVEDSKPKMLSSFRFAANSIFGDGYNWDSDNNGFVKAFAFDFRDILEQNKLRDKADALQEILLSKNSADICSFFFSLKEGNTILALDFLDKLAVDSKFKYVFVLFYSLLVYFVAKQMKAKGMRMPQTIAFSGNGSKTLQILSPDNKTIAAYFASIIENVYGKSYEPSSSLDLIYESAAPKIATCKGGILMDDEKALGSVAEITTALLGTDDNTFIDTQKYSSITEKEKNEIVAQVERSIDTIFNIGTTNKFFFNGFALDSSKSDAIKAICKQNLRTYLDDGISARMRDLNAWEASDVIEETLFFYPVVGMLNNVARELASM